MPTHVIFLVLFAALLHASWNALLRSGADRLWSMTVMCIAIAITSVVAAMFMVPPAIESWGYGVLSGLLHGAVSALRETSVLFAVLIGYVFLGETLTTRRILACVVIASGTFIIG